MSKKYPGLYLYYDWIDVLLGLPAGKAMAIIKNLRNYAQYGTEPQPLDGTAGSLQSLFLAQLNRAKINAENGKMGGANTHKNRYETKESAVEDQPIPIDNSDVLTQDDFEKVEDFFAYIKARCAHIRNYHKPPQGL